MYSSCSLHYHGVKKIVQCISPDTIFFTTAIIVGLKINGRPGDRSVIYDVVLQNKIKNLHDECDIHSVVAVIQVWLI